MWAKLFAFNSSLYCWKPSLPPPLCQRTRHVRTSRYTFTSKFKGCPTTILPKQLASAASILAAAPRKPVPKSKSQNEKTDTTFIRPTAILGVLYLTPAFVVPHLGLSIPKFLREQMRFADPLEPIHVLVAGDLLDGESASGHCRRSQGSPGSSPSQNLRHQISRRWLGDVERPSELVTNPPGKIVGILFEVEKLNLHSPQPLARDEGAHSKVSYLRKGRRST